MKPAYDVAVELEERGDLESAIICYQTLAADDARAGVMLGNIHGRAGHWGLAADAYRQATKTAPDYALAWYNLGKAFDELMRSAEAQKAYETCLALDPNNSYAHFNLARLMENRRQPRKALKHWRKYVQLEPVSKDRERAVRAIKKTISVEKLQIVWRRP